MKGNVFNIQRFSLHDGPGIRTVVFLKGCPLRCEWCANPESQLMRTQIVRDKNKCRNCWACRRNEECPTGALTSYGEERELSEVLAECLRDEPFYVSGGGVTLSGGEPLMQPEFAGALLDALKEAGIDSAIETTGYCVPDIFMKIASRANHLLFDMKHWDAAAHMRGTGVTNETILENLRHAVGSGMDVLVRTPVIPGFNSSIHDAEMLSDRVLKAGAHRVQLLPFHQFGEKKYSLLDKPYVYAEAAPLHAEDLTEFAAVYERAGIDVSVSGS